MPTAFHVTGLGQVALTAKDLPQTRAFYENTLGLKHLFSAGGKMEFFACGGVRLMIAVPEKPEFDHPNSILYLRVDDIDTAHAALAAQGVAFDHPPALAAPMKTHDLWMAFFRDPEQNVLALMEERPRAGESGDQNR